MPINKENSEALIHKDMTLILAMSDRLDAQAINLRYANRRRRFKNASKLKSKPSLNKITKAIARNLNDNRGIYYAYSILDALSCAYSTFKYYFDLCVTANNNDLMHLWLLTPGGILVVASESIFMVAFSVLACHFENAENDSVKQFIATAWLYFRDMLKALKNAYKGWRSAILVVNALAGVDLKFTILPVGLLFGLFATAIRLWGRVMQERQKAMSKANASLLKEIKQINHLTQNQYDSFLRRIQYQTLTARSCSYIAVTVGGFIDGLYLYVGIMGLAVLSPHFLAIVAAICALFTAICIATRIYEEWEFQLKLEVSQTKCKLELASKYLDMRYTRLLELADLEFKTLTQREEMNQLKLEVYNLIVRFEKTRNVLKNQLHRSYFSAFIYGLKNGLYAYGAISSSLFIIATILTLCSTTLPPALLIATVLMGLVLMAVGVIHSLYVTYVHLKQENNKENTQYKVLIDMKNRLNNSIRMRLKGDDFLLDKASFNESLQKGLDVKQAPQYYFKEGFEILRSLFTGFGKGQKFSDFSWNFLQEMDLQGHYHDSPIMLVLAAGYALVFGVILALRAFARGFGRQDPVAQKEMPIKVNYPVGYRAFRLSKEKKQANAKISSSTQSKTVYSPRLFNSLNSKTEAETVRSKELKLRTKVTNEFLGGNTVRDLNLGHCTF